MLHKEYLLFFVLLLTYRLEAFSNDCHIRFSLCVVDVHDGSGISFAEIRLNGSQQPIIADENGCFDTTLCAGNYQIHFKHLTGEEGRTSLLLQHDTSIVLQLEQHIHLLESVTVQAEKSTFSSDASKHTLSGSLLRDKGSANLGEAISSINGVSLIKTGPAILQPVIHGLYGYRIGIVQDGGLLFGQRWGVDHSPESDPYFASRISIVKGSESVRYGMQASGGAVISESPEMPSENKVHGSVHYGFRSNNLQHFLAAKLEGGLPAKSFFKWRLSSSGQIAGDATTPNYRLTNSGQQILNTNAVGEFQHNNQKHQLSFSTYRADIGILRGSHIGNLTDLTNALNREIPLFTAPFSYNIVNPRQHINHYSLAAISTIPFGTANLREFSYRFQHNNRKEFDVRRAGRSEIPAIDLVLHSHFIEASQKTFWKSGEWMNQFGIQNLIQINNNKPGTGVRPVIPNYNLLQPSVYYRQKLSKKRLELEQGFRYDFSYMEVKKINDNNQSQQTYQRYHACAIHAGINWQAMSWLQWRNHTSFSVRAPQINELYSNGLHHGTATIEEGDPNLTGEKMFLVSTSLSANPHRSVFLEVNPYFRYFADFIYLEPQAEPRLTVRGAFPVFLYKQTNARFTGIDISGRFEFVPLLFWDSRVSIVRALNTTTDEYLPLIPSDRIYNKISYAFRPGKKLSEVQTGLEGNWVLKQYRIPENVDIAPPPDAYFLLNWYAYFRFNLNKYHCRLNIAVNNLLNATYRDYLNQWRYYADDTGTDFQINWQFYF